jgi:hypothetical protein
MPHTCSRGSRPTICNFDPFVSPTPYSSTDSQTDKQAQEPIHSPHASPVPAPKVKAKKEDSDVFDQVDESKKMDGKKVAMMLGSAIWLTVKFILYVHPLFVCF